MTPNLRYSEGNWRLGRIEGKLRFSALGVYLFIQEVKEKGDDSSYENSECINWQREGERTIADLRTFLAMFKISTS